MLSFGESKLNKQYKVWILIFISVAVTLWFIFHEETFYQNFLLETQYKHKNDSSIIASAPVKLPPTTSQDKLEQDNIKTLVKPPTLHPSPIKIIIGYTDTNESPMAMDNVHFRSYSDSPPYTECERDYMGWSQFGKGNHDFGDFSFTTDQLQYLCRNDDYEIDKRYAHIECYNTHWKNGHVCIMKNVYAYLDGYSGDNLRFEAYCKQNLSKAAQGLYQKLKDSYKSRGGFPLHFEISTEKEFNEKNYEIIDMNKPNNNDVWFYDNSDQCESMKKGEKNHVGNPWHCFGHNELWYHIAHKLKLLNIFPNGTLRTNDSYNITLNMQRYNNQQFGSEIPIFHFHTPFFNNVVNKNNIETLMNQKEMIYIKQFILDERAALGFGAAGIWNWAIPKIFPEMKQCKNYTQLQRSPIAIEMKQIMTNYYESTPSYANYSWIQEINEMAQDENKFEVHGNLDDTLSNKEWIIFVGSRWINGICRYRCIGNQQQLKDRVVQFFHEELNMKDSVIIISGNPGKLTFRAQYHLFKHTKLFIGVHGAVFLMAGLFMPPYSLKYEIKFPDTPQSNHVINMFGDGIHHVYHHFVCKECKAKRGIPPKNINVEAFMKEMALTLNNSHLFSNHLSRFRRLAKMSSIIQTIIEP